MKKWLLIVLGILVVVLIVVGFLTGWGKNITWFGQEKKSEKINVQALSDPKEQKLGTILYPGAKMTSGDVKEENGVQKATFETTDTLDGAANIYYQDLTNRYPSYSVSKKESKKTDALNQKSIVLTCKGETGKIQITIWGDKNGLTQIEVATDKSFK